jgi:hypothetical protein
MPPTLAASYALAYTAPTCPLSLSLHTQLQAVWNSFLFNRQYLGKLPRSWPKFEYIMRARWFSFHGLAPYEDEDWASFDAAEANYLRAVARAP